MDPFFRKPRARNRPSFRSPSEKLRNPFRSFKFQLILSFVLVSILPIELVQLYSHYAVVTTMKEHADELVDVNLRQTRRSLDTMLEACDDFLFQIYTDDELVACLKEVYEGTDTAFNSNLIRRRLNGFATSKPAVRCVTVVTPGGRIIAYDKLTPTSLESSWLGGDGNSIPDLYRSVTARKETSIFSRGQPVWFAENPNHLFHLAHRIIDYRRVFADLGIVVISLDETVLAEVCNDGTKQGDTSTVNFITDDTGMLISFPERSRIGTRIPPSERPGDAFRHIVREAGIFEGNQSILRTITDGKTGWTIVSVADLSGFFSRLRAQQRIAAVIAISASLLLIGIILLITNRLSSSVSTIARSMMLAGGGDLTVRIRHDRRMPHEMLTIALGFNDMAERLGKLIEEVKLVSDKQRETEIRFLEAQINPHFLYNALDSINWMAIDREEYEISDMIGSLARILRYGVDGSNAVVTAGDELEWLRQYILLQQIRFKYSFTCSIDADDSVLGFRLHKLLLQPFVENSIVHGFSGMKEGGRLEVNMAGTCEVLTVTITDNGCGLPPGIAGTVDLNGGIEDFGNVGIGIGNALHRLRMYYGGRAGFTAESSSAGTRIRITVPALPGGTE